MAKRTKKKHYTIYRLNEYGTPDALIKDCETDKEAEQFIKEIDDFHRYAIIKTFR